MAVLLQTLVGAARRRDRQGSRAGVPRLLPARARRCRCGSCARSRSWPAIWPKCWAPRSGSSCCSAAAAVGRAASPRFDVLLLLALSRLGMRRLEAFIIVLSRPSAPASRSRCCSSRPDLAAILRGFIPRGDDGRPTLFARATGRRSGGARPPSRVALHRDGHPRRHGDAAQPLPAQRAGPEPRGRADSSRASARHAGSTWWTRSWRSTARSSSTLRSWCSRPPCSTRTGHQDVARLEDAHRLLAPLLGTSLASTLFAVALLSSGQSSTITGTLAGQIVMEGFLRMRIRPWLRRLISREPRHRAGGAVHRRCAATPRSTNCWCSRRWS